MTIGRIQARHFASQLPVQLEWRNRVITCLDPASAVPADLPWLAPPLVDPQVNGFSGVDFQSDGLTMEDMSLAVEQLARAGCTRFLLTLITDEWSRLLARLQHLRALRAASAALRKAIVGWHIEGPFLSREPGFHGTHDPAHMFDPTSQHLRELRRITGDDRVLLTLAPERPGALAAIAEATALGLRVSLGHTNASTDVLRDAVAAGATGFTHLGNGCPQTLDRHDNILWRMLDLGAQIQVSLIPDGIHISPALFRLFHRLLKPEAVCYTTDAMAAAGAPPGSYSLGKLRLQVGSDQIVREPGRTNYAGSALRPIDGVFRAAKMLGQPWQAVWPYLSTAPARFLGLPAGLEPGAPADFCLLQMTEEGQLTELRVFRDGQQLV